ncbi:MAG TPA: FAD-dependent oxidoreductase [Xanthobacteraceae bacterium]|jgi:2-polyprenyl-6-methoxyphenol hydroxylase-like FAD-dependent oxidoreductase
MANQLTAGCCIVGGGPCGMMLGYLLARAGVEVVVLEKHADFLRDFRGDTIHPSTLELMHELGLLSDFLALPHQEVRELKARFGDIEFIFADFSHLPTHCKFIALMPQWDFLNFLSERGRLYPGFRVIMRAEATDLVEEAGAVVGVRANTPDGALELRSPLVVGCDGRHSLVRHKAGLEVENFGAPMDVLWFRVSRKPGDPAEAMGLFEAGHIFVMINRGDYWQCGYVIPKGSFEEVRRRGLTQFCAQLARTMPLFTDRVGELASWDQIKLLTVAVDRLKRWYRRGLICIGDAAHAMSPVGGVGINLAVQDAVAAANILAEPLLAGAVGEGLLRRVQKRREFPTRVIQRAQVLVQERVITGVLGQREEIKPPLLVKLLWAVPMLRRIPARILGIGIRPEHIRTPERPAAAKPGGVWQK